MPYYYTLGKIPPKRHTQFHKPDDDGLYSEELFSTEGFSNDSTLLYHVYPPTQIIKTGSTVNISPEVAGDDLLKHRSFEGFKIKPAYDFLESRVPVLVNNDVHIVLAAPQASLTDYYYKNADADEMIFVHDGTGVLKTMYGDLPFSYGDYLIIPRGTIYQVHFNNHENRLLIAESFSPIRFPKKYLSKYGQLLEHSPYCERDIRPPLNLETHTQKGDFLVRTKKKGMLHNIHYAGHPFDVIGWDGCCYPFAFSIHDFEPITGRLHQPPPVHQTFEAHNFVVCSFVPRLYDYHPQSIPAPYNHSNIDSDEVLYYVDGDFMSRKTRYTGHDHFTSRRHTAWSASRGRCQKYRRQRNKGTCGDDRHLSPIEAYQAGFGKLKMTAIPKAGSSKFASQKRSHVLFFFSVFFLEPGIYSLLRHRCVAHLYFFFFAGHCCNHSFVVFSFFFRSKEKKDLTCTFVLCEPKLKDAIPLVSSPYCKVKNIGDLVPLQLSTPLFCYHLKGNI